MENEKLVANKNYTQTVTVRVEDEVHQRILCAADAMGLGLAGFLRKSIKLMLDSVGETKRREGGVALSLEVLETSVDLEMREFAMKVLDKVTLKKASE